MPKTQCDCNKASVCTVMARCKSKSLSIGESNNNSNRIDASYCQLVKVKAPCQRGNGRFPKRQNGRNPEVSTHTYAHTHAYASVNVAISVRK